MTIDSAPPRRATPVPGVVRGAFAPAAGSRRTGRSHATIIRLRALLAATALALATTGFAADPAKVLRLATGDLDTLDPQQLQDVYSRNIAAAIYEGMFEWSYLDRPPQPVPRTAAGPVAMSADRKTWTIRLQPGVRFTADPAFRGKPRELTADDYVYSIKRALDPNLRGGGDPLLADLIVGMRPVVDAASRPGARMDYDAKVEGLRALDRHTLQVRFTEANYPAGSDVLFVQAVAREVVEAAGGDIQARAVGTGPYMLAEWQRGSRVVLVANPDYRPLAFPESRDPAHAALVAQMRGKRLPQIGRIELSVIDEHHVRVLEFESGKLDSIVLRGEAVGTVLRNGELNPALAARGIRRIPYTTNSVRSLWVNMEDPVVGGMDNERVALRRAASLAIDVDTLIRVIYSGQAVAANQPMPPGIAGHDATVPRRVYAPATAVALLDRMGYTRRDGEGYRMTPDGRPLTVTLTIFTGTVWREIQTLLKKNMDAIGLRMAFRSVPVQDLFKEVARGQFAVTIHGRSQTPNGMGYQQFYGPAPPEANESRFRSAEYDAAFRAFLLAPTAETRMPHARRMIEIVRAYVPLIPLLIDVENAFVQPWVQGLVPSSLSSYFQYLDVDMAYRR